MRHLFIRPESKPKDKLGRGATIVMYDTLGRAIFSLLSAYMESYNYTADEFHIKIDEDDKVSIEVFNDHDYYRWLDIINKNVYHITLEQYDVLEGKEVSGTVGGFRFVREEIEIIGYNEELITLDGQLTIKRNNVVDEPMPSLEEEPTPLVDYVPMTEIIGFDDTYDLPVNTISSHSFLGKFFSFLGGLVNKSEGGYVKTRKPVTVFESHLGGHIAIYKSLQTDKEVDIALFNRYGNVINVFSFQDGCPSTVGVNGFTVEDIIGIASWRILHLNSFIAAEENLIAATHLNDAVEQLNARTMRRHQEQTSEGE